jgi:hypothetical protein
MEAQGCGRRSSPQSPGLLKYWLRNRRGGRSELGNWFSHPADRNQPGHSFGSTHHFGLKIGLRVHNGSYCTMQVQRWDIIHSRVLYSPYGQLPSVASFLVTDSSDVKENTKIHFISPFGTEGFVSVQHLLGGWALVQTHWIFRREDLHAL